MLSDSCHVSNPPGRSGARTGRRHVPNTLPDSGAGHRVELDPTQRQQAEACPVDTWERTARKNSTFPLTRPHPPRISPLRHKSNHLMSHNFTPTILQNGLLACIPKVTQLEILTIDLREKRTNRRGSWTRCGLGCRARPCDISAPQWPGPTRGIAVEPYLARPLVRNPGNRELGWSNGSGHKRPDELRVHRGPCGALAHRTRSAGKGPNRDPTD